MSKPWTEYAPEQLMRSLLLDMQTMQYRQITEVASNVVKKFGDDPIIRLREFMSDSGFPFPTDYKFEMTGFGSLRITRRKVTHLKNDLPPGFRRVGIRTVSRD